MTAAPEKAAEKAAEKALQEVLDDLVRLAAHVCDAPIAAVCLLDGQRPCFQVVAGLGLEVAETLHGNALCVQTLLQPGLMVVPDARADPRFAGDPRVTGAPHIRFYAGVPLIAEDGGVLGCLCVLDRVAHPLKAAREAALCLVARQVTSQLEATHRVTERERLAADKEALMAEKEALAAEWKRGEAALAQTYAALADSEARLAEAQRVAQIGSWGYDLVENKITWSEELFRLFGLDPADGEPDYEAAVALYHPEDASRLDALVARAVQEGIGYTLDLRGAPGAMPDGQPKWYHTVGTAATDASGRVVRLTGTLADITERKRAEEALRRSEAGLRTVLEAAPIIMYAVNADGVVTLCEGMGLAALGLKAGDVVGCSALDFCAGDAKSEAMTRRALTGEAVSYDAHVYGLCLHTEMRPVRGADGALTGLIGICFDITERVASEERFRVLFERSSDAHLLFDTEGIIDCNDAAVALLCCREKSQVVSLHPAALSPEFQPDGRRSLEKCVEMDALARQKGFHRFEWTHLKMDGTAFPVEVTLTPVALEGRSVLLVVWHDLTERKHQEEQIKDHAIVLEFQKRELEKANAELAALATTDGMTGLKNHRAFQERLAEEVCRADRYGTPLALILLDVDHFKGYNDTYGHPAGDTVLRAVAQVLQVCTRDTDLAARYGGEEFVVVLPQTDRAGAEAIAERIRAAVAAHPWPARAVTVSLGVASLRLGGESGADLLARTDEALYLAKTSGRDQVGCLL